MSSERARGYLRIAADASREGRHVDARAALRLAKAACTPLPASAPERVEVAVATAEVEQRAGDQAAAAAAFADAAARDRAAGRADALATVRRLRAALAADAAGDRAAASKLAEEATKLAAALGQELQDHAREVRERIEHGVERSPDAAPVPVAAATPPVPDESVETLLSELDELVGLRDVKEEVRKLVALAQVAQARTAAGMPAGDRTRHLAMVGAPGTGKTTVARLLGRIYGALDVVGSGHLVEVTRSDLVAGYVGQTAQRTNAVCDKALGGVLFVDEAYSLAGADDDQFGEEALAELVKRMEDDRARLVVILAGYENEMERMLSANTGLRSRLQQTLAFADYTPAELAEIFDTIAARERWRTTDPARAAAHAALAEMHAARGPDWANARTARTFFERCLAQHALRVTADGTVGAGELDLLDAADIAAAATSRPE